MASWAACRFMQVTSGISAAAVGSGDAAGTVGVGAAGVVGTAATDVGATALPAVTVAVATSGTVTGSDRDRALHRHDLTRNRRRFAAGDHRESTNGCKEQFPQPPGMVRFNDRSKASVIAHFHNSAHPATRRGAAKLPTREETHGARERSLYGYISSKFPQSLSRRVAQFGLTGRTARPVVRSTRRPVKTARRPGRVHASTHSPARRTESRGPRPASAPAA